MDLELIPEIKNVNWKLTGTTVIVERNRGNLLLNNTVSIVWGYIDGFKTIKDIIDNLFIKYEDNNTIDYINELVIESLTLLEKNELIILKDYNEYDGWFSYE